MTFVPVLGHSLMSYGGNDDKPGRARALVKNKTLAVHAGASVRRLTPTECERLQALPDGWTDPDGTAADSRRYAGLGDAVTASVGEWIGHRIVDADRELAA
jgi:site-specific DNA-cytosine methylase